MLPWIANPSPVTPPAQSRQAGPVCVADAAVRVDDPDLAVVTTGVLLEQPLQSHRGGGAVVEMRERLALVGDVRPGLGGDGADARHGGGYGGAHGQELGGDGDPPGLAVGGSGHDREGHAAESSDVGYPVALKPP